MYDSLVDLYDWEHQRFLDDVPLYEGFARRASGPILDAACGTGRVLLPLALAGYSVTGVDISTNMLAAARTKLQSAGEEERVQLVHADLRSMDLDRRFTMAFVAISSFHHLLSVGDQKLALERLAWHLESGGMLILDLINPSPAWLAAGDGALVLQVTAPFPAEDPAEAVSKFVVRATDFESQIDHMTMIYDQVAKDGMVRRRQAEMMLRFLFRFEAQLLVEGAGFRLRALYGDYDLTKYRESSPRMIVVAEKL